MALDGLKLEPWEVLSIGDTPENDIYALKVLELMQCISVMPGDVYNLLHSSFLKI